MVSVAVPAVVPVMLTGLVVPKLKVGGYVPFAGLEVTAAVSATLPVKPPEGVMVTVAVFPVVAPAVSVSDELLRVKVGVGGGTAVTVTVAELLDEL
jgi:hypothetical protein